MNTEPNQPNRRRLRTLTIVLATALLVAPAAAFATGGFDDVQESDFFSDAVGWMKDNGVTVGCNPPSNTRYCPDDFVTRGQMAVFLERLDTKDVFLRPSEDSVDGGNADTLDGKDSGAFVSGEGTLHEELGSPVDFTGANNDLLSITFTAPDECGDGSTEHNYIVLTDAHFFTTATPNQPTRLDINFDGTDVNDGTTTINVDIRNSNPSPHAWLTGVTPGSHTVKTQGTTTGGGTIEVQEHQLTVIPAGWSCG